MKRAISLVLLNGLSLGEYAQKHDTREEWNISWQCLKDRTSSRAVRLTSIRAVSIFMYLDPK